VEVFVWWPHGHMYSLVGVIAIVFPVCGDDEL